VKPEQSILARIPMVLFFVTGVFWAGIIATGGGALLGWAVLSCFASGIFLVMWASNWVTRPLASASSLFGVALTLYQLFVALTALGNGTSTFAIVSVPLFAVFTAIYVYLFYSCTWRTKA